MRDFTLQTYRRLCEILKRCGCPIVTVDEFARGSGVGSSAVVLRHDVDRSLPCALRMGRLEAALGIRATYYIRMTRTVFKPAAIQTLHRQGHEIGYHYEVLSKTRGDPNRAIGLFETELRQLRKLVPVTTISMHGSPLKPWNNLDLWKKYDFRRYGLSAEASLSLDYSNIYYFTDTGRSWAAGKYNLRDHAAARTPPEPIRTTHDLAQFIKERADGPVLINTHPNRWSATVIEYLISGLADWSANRVKAVLAGARR